MVTAVRSEQLTVCRVRYGPELYGKIIRIDDDPPTLFVGAPARTGQEGGRGYVVSVYGLRTFLTDCHREMLDDSRDWLLRLWAAPRFPDC